MKYNWIFYDIFGFKLDFILKLLYFLRKVSLNKVTEVYSLKWILLTSAQKAFLYFVLIYCNKKTKSLFFLYFLFFICCKLLSQCHVWLQIIMKLAQTVENSSAMTWGKYKQRSPQLRAGTRYWYVSCNCWKHFCITWSFCIINFCWLLKRIMKNNQHISPFQTLLKNISCLKFWVLSAFEQYNQHTLALTHQAQWMTFFLVML